MTTSSSAADAPAGRDLEVLILNALPHPVVTIDAQGKIVCGTPGNEIAGCPLTLASTVNAALRRRIHRPPKARPRSMCARRRRSPSCC